MLPVGLQFLWTLSNPNGNELFEGLTTARYALICKESFRPGLYQRFIRFTSLMNSFLLL